MFTHVLYITYKKNIKESMERLIDLKPYNIIRMKIILDNPINQLNLMKVDEKKNVDDMEIKIMMQEGKIRLERIKKNI